MNTPSKNDVKLASRDAIKFLMGLFGPLSDEKIEIGEKMFVDLFYQNPPPVGLEEGPCNHDYENKHWCPRCNGGVDEQFRPITKPT